MAESTRSASLRTGVTSFYVDTVRVTPCAPDREPEAPDALTPRTRPSDPTAGS